MEARDADQSEWFKHELLVHEPVLRAWLHSRFPKDCDIDDVVQEAYLGTMAGEATC